MIKIAVLENISSSSIPVEIMQDTKIAVVKLKQYSYLTHTCIYIIYTYIYYIYVYTYQYI